MIDTTTWKVGGFNTSKVVPSTLYTKEITSPSTQVTSTYESKIGLMYVSDYGFAASPTAWTTTLYNYNGNDTSENKITEENWMYIGLVEWTIAHSSFFSNFAYSVGTLGYVIDDIVDGGGRAVRPVFHLTSKVIKLEGSGELENPVRIGIGA